MTDNNMQPQIPMPALPPRPGEASATPMPQSTPTYPDTSNMTPQPAYPDAAGTASPTQPQQQYPGYPEQPSQPYAESSNTAYAPAAQPYAGGANIPPSIPAGGAGPSNEYQPQQPIPVTVVQQAPAYKLKTNRSLLKYILLGIVTLGIYDIVVMYDVTESTNMVATPHDGRKSTNYLLMYFLFGWLSLGIAWLVWYSNLSDRIGNELQRRGMPREVSMSDFWLWCILGSLIIVGPFIYLYKLLKATNMMCEDYNARG